MTPLAAAIANSHSGGAVVATATGSGSAAPMLIRGIPQAVGGWQTGPTARELAAEDALWESTTITNADAVDALLASLDRRAAKGEDSPLDFKKF